jgi:PBP1b-binding outer membrane lipoprotein LpoB
MRPVIANIAGMVAFMALLTTGCASDETMPASGSSMSSSSPTQEMKSTSGPSMTSTNSSMSTGSAAASASASGTTKNIDRIASGSAEDSLEACLSRIPKDASSGQRMLAEQSCHRDQSVR